MDDKLTLSIDDYEICNKLKSMRFSGMAQALEELFSDPNADMIPFREKVSRLVDAEWNLRYTKKLHREPTKEYSGMYAEYQEKYYSRLRKIGA